MDDTHFLFPASCCLLVFKQDTLSLCLNVIHINKGKRMWGGPWGAVGGCREPELLIPDMRTPGDSHSNYLTTTSLSTKLHSKFMKTFQKRAPPSLMFHLLKELDIEFFFCFMKKQVHSWTILPLLIICCTSEQFNSHCPGATIHLLNQTALALNLPCTPPQWPHSFYFWLHPCFLLS